MLSRYCDIVNVLLLLQWLLECDTRNRTTGATAEAKCWILNTRTKTALVSGQGYNSDDGYSITD
jgi:hypothetical protein